MKKNIPFFSLGRQWNKYKIQFQQAIDEVLESQQFIGGKFIKEFEEKLAKYLNVSSVISCNSGTDALWLALKALKLQKDDIVLTTPFSFIASSSEVVAHQGHPVFIDIDQDTFNLCPKKLSLWLEQNAEFKDGQTIHKETGFKIPGLIVVNIFGQIADFKAIRAIADKWNLWIIEDAAQSIGAHSDNKYSGTFGDIATFSFYPTKNMGAFGDGGCCTTSNPELASRLEMLRNHGRFQKYDYIEYGINSRLDAIQAVVLSKKIDLIDSFNQRRHDIANIYKTNLQDLDFIKFPKEVNGKHIYHQFCVIIDGKRDAFMEHLETNDIGSVIFYPVALNLIEFLQTDKRLISKCPIAEHASENIISLPVWPELTNEEVEYICQVVRSFNITSVINKENTVAI